MGHFWRQRRGLCTFPRSPIRSFGRAVSQQLWPLSAQPSRPALLTSPHSSFPSSSHSLSPQPPSHAVVCLSFFVPFLVSHPPSWTSPPETLPSLSIPLHTVRQLCLSVRKIGEKPLR